MEINWMRSLSRWVELTRWLQKSEGFSPLCTATPAGHEQTWFTIITKEKKRMVGCCVPSTISFAQRSEAEAFQKKYDGKLYTLEQALKNIEKIRY